MDEQRVEILIHRGKNIVQETVEIFDFANQRHLVVPIEDINEEDADDNKSKLNIIASKVCLLQLLMIEIKDPLEQALKAKKDNTHELVATMLKLMNIRSESDSFMAEVKELAES